MGDMVDLNCIGDDVEVFFCEDYVCCVFGCVRVRVYRDIGVCGVDGKIVVDIVVEYIDVMVGFFEMMDYLGFLGGSQFGEDFVILNCLVEFFFIEKGKVWFCDGFDVV